MRELLFGICMMVVAACVFGLWTAFWVWVSGKLKRDWIWIVAVILILFLPVCYNLGYTLLHCPTICGGK